MNIYDFTVQKQDGTDQSMAEYQGQVLLIVNTAPGCGLAPQYKELTGGVGKNSTKSKRVRLPTPAQLIRLDLECKTRTNLPINHCAEMLTQTLRSGPGLFAQPHRGQGFVVLDFPCNQFLNQAPGSAEDINQTCSLNYGTTFPRFAKIAVNGSEASPLYRYLKKEKSTLLGGRIEWNFTKFLVDRQGRVVKRYLPTTSPLKLKEDIELYLEK